MPWELRSGRAYFYRLVRRDGRLVRRYVGRGPQAEASAAEEADERRRRMADQELWKNRQAMLRDADRFVAEFSAGVKLLTQASLLAAGYHQHRGTWRKKRHGRCSTG